MESIAMPHPRLVEDEPFLRVVYGLSDTRSIFAKRLSQLRAAHSGYRTSLKQCSVNDERTSSGPEVLPIAVQIRSAKWVTVAQLAQSQKAFTEHSIRYLIYAAKSRKRSIGRSAADDIPGNGLESAIRRVGRRVLIDEIAFLQWVEAHSPGAKAA
jgi:hypothetical protein